MCLSNICAIDQYSENCNKIMTKLSIITINYNNKEGLQKTIESVVNQTSQDFEYIIIDGGSTDGSVDVIQRFNDSTIQHFTWISEPDTGIYNAMNKGIRKASGEYCQFINSGDCLVSNDVTEKMLTNMPECSILYGNMLKEIKGKIFTDKSFKGGEITMLDMYTGTLNHSSAYIKKDLFHKYGLYDESLKIVSDWKFYFISIGLHNETVAYKNIDVTLFDMNGISEANLQLRKEERKRVLKKLLPKPIYNDYEFFGKYGRMIKRLKNNRFIWFFIKNSYRLLAKFDRIINR